MKKILKYIVLLAVPFVISCSGTPKLEVDLPDKYEGQNVELVNYVDSTILVSSVIKDGKAVLVPPAGEPSFTAVVIDGRISAFYITEPGVANLRDSVNSAFGTPLNDRFNLLLARLDSVEQYDDMDIYLDFVEKNYNDNKDNPIGEYFGIEWLRYADPEKVDSMLIEAPAHLRDSSKARYYEKFAKLRSQTSPGKPYVDFMGEDEKGNPVQLSALMTPGNYTLIDFWASWCPYCIKELPELKDLHEKWKDHGVDIIGVAVRDLPEDTGNAVAKHAIPWKVMYNTQKTPYDIYGFSGIPHHILIGPDGVIISRGESAGQLEERLSGLLSENDSDKK